MAQYPGHPLRWSTRGIMIACEVMSLATLGHEVAALTMEAASKAIEGGPRAGKSG